MESKNAFIKLQESANGRVAVKLQKNQFSKDGTFYGKVERQTFSTRNIIDSMTESLPLVDAGTMASVLNTFANSVLKALAAGYAVRLGELGTFYIAGKGVVENGEKPALTVKFTASQILKDAVQNLEISSSEYKIPAGVISSITDIATGKSDGKISAGSSVLIEGSGLKVGGEGSGIYFAAVGESGDVSAEKDWIKVEGVLVYNLPSKLLFALPQVIASGKYKVVVRTHYAGKSDYERKYLVETVSDAIDIA